MPTAEQKAPREAHSAVEVARALGLKVASGTDQQAIVRCPSRSHPDKNPSAVMRHGARGHLWVHCRSCGFSGGLVAVLRQSKVGYSEEAARRYIARVLAGVRNVELVERLPRASSDIVAECLPDLVPAMQDRDGHAFLVHRGFPTYGRYPDLAVLPPGRARKDLAETLRRALSADAWQESPSTQGDDFWGTAYRLVILHRAPDGSVCAAPRRSIEEGAALRYLCPPAVALLWPFGVAEFLANRSAQAVICEGALDALAYRELFGAESAVLGLPGADTWRDEWGHLFKDRHSVVLALDNDAAGHRGAAVVEASIRKLIPSLAIERKVPSSGRDWGEELQRVRLA